MRTILREHGMGVKQVMAVTMDEARNATHFGDAESLPLVIAVLRSARRCGRSIFEPLGKIFVHIFNPFARLLHDLLNLCS